MQSSGSNGRATSPRSLRSTRLIASSPRTTSCTGVHERCGTDIEYLVVGQWFIRVLDEKERVLEAGRRINWYTDHMRGRYATADGP